MFRPIIPDNYEPALLTLGALVAEQLPAQQVLLESWPELISLSLFHGLGPMLWWIVKRAGKSTTDDSLWSPLAKAARTATVHSMVLEDAQAQVQQALTAAGIPALWMKGIVLAKTLYPQPELRPMVDLDVLIPYEQRKAALKVAESLGYGLHPDDLFAHNRNLAHYYRLHHYHLVGGKEDSVHLEVHFRVLGVGGENSVLPLQRLSWFWQPSQIYRVHGQFAAWKAEPHLLYLCAHAVLEHGEGEFRLLRYFDLHRLITQTALNWALVTEQAVALGWTYAVEQALNVSMRFFNTLVPNSVVDELRARCRAPGHAPPIIMRMPETSDWEILYEQFPEMSVWERLQVMRVFLFPPATFMRQGYRVEPGRSLWPYYLYRCFDLGRKLCKQLWLRALSF